MVSRYCVERQVVDAAALEVDAAAEPRRLDGDARRRARSPLRAWRSAAGAAAPAGSARRRRAGCGAPGARRRWRRLGRAGLHLRLLLLLELRLLRAAAPSADSR